MQLYLSVDRLQALFCKCFFNFDSDLLFPQEIDLHNFQLVSKVYFSIWNRSKIICYAN